MTDTTVNFGPKTPSDHTNSTLPPGEGRGESAVSSGYRVPNATPHEALGGILTYHFRRNLVCHAVVCSVYPVNR